MTEPPNPSEGDSIELRIPVPAIGHVRDAVHEARKNYEEDSLAEEPDEIARSLRSVERDLDRIVFG